MPIHLITGIPGHGKTAQAVKLLIEANAENAKLVAAGKTPRPIYAAGFDGLEDGLAEPLDDPTNWCHRVHIGNGADGKPLWEYKSNLPHGALVFVDEAWKWFGHLQGASRDTPTHILGLAEHRHWGLDFVWTAQGVGQMYPFLRPLVSPHWHTVRKFGTQQIDLYKWEELCEDVKSQASRDRANKVVTVLPSSTFGKYKSASEHTIKARLPWKVWLIPVVIVVALVAAFYAWKSLTPEAMAARAKAPEAGLPADGARSHGYNATEAGKAPTMTPAEWVERLKPRFPGLHGSAPVFDDRPILSTPRRHCIISGEGHDDQCNCYTEQGTPLRTVHPKECRQVARWGEYDPFRAEPEPGIPYEKAEPELVQVAPPSGSRAAPEMVGTAEMGTVQGRKPATLRASGG